MGGTKVRGPILGRVGFCAEAGDLCVIEKGLRDALAFLKKRGFRGSAHLSAVKALRANKYA